MYIHRTAALSSRDALRAARAPSVATATTLLSPLAPGDFVRTPEKAPLAAPRARAARRGLRFGGQAVVLPLGFFRVSEQRSAGTGECRRLLEGNQDPRRHELEVRAVRLARVDPEGLLAHRR